MATLLLLHLRVLALSAFFGFSNAVFTSIDCGSKAPYKDRNNITWIGDDAFVQTGLPVEVPIPRNYSITRKMMTLRVFPTRNKNCYTIPVQKDEKVLLRAGFFYGNYDKKSSPPTFHLQFDGNSWIEVRTFIDQVVFHEVIYITRTDNISVCVSSLNPGMFPFISSIEVRSLDKKMYGFVSSDFALIKRRRVAYGARKIIRYPFDPYDRIWTPGNNSAGLFTVARSSAKSINITLDDKPPEAVIRNAFIFPNTSLKTKFLTDLPTSEASVYMNLYFSEILKLKKTQNRSFTFVVDNLLRSNPIIPPYGKVMELTFFNYSASAANLFFLNATKNSTLPPLINAFEVYTVSDILTNGTYSNDVEGLNVLKNAFDVLKDWTGDPCLPSPFVWDWLNCSTDATPRVTSLYLGSFSLSGSLPDFNTMDALETIDLHNNSLNGSIPEFLGRFPNLKLLNLSYNDFSGTIPSSLLNLKIDVSGNPNLKNGSQIGNQTNISPASPQKNSGKRGKINQLITLAAAAFSAAALVNLL